MPSGNALTFQLRRAAYALGRIATPRFVQHVDNALNYVASGQWVRQRKLQDVPSFSDRAELFGRIARDVGDARTLYLEFGVYRGESIRIWSELLQHPDAHLHGFDSFEGLPEDWTEAMPHGHFSTGGEIPIIDDPRVSFFKGWFDQVLPGYTLPEHDRLVLSLDADLYSSTTYVLQTLEEYIVPGTYLYFDEFCHRHHEMKAFEEFERRTRMKFEVVGQSGWWEHAAFLRTA